MSRPYSIHPRDTSVFRFLSSESSYIAYCDDNLRLDIAKCRNYVPANIRVEDHHHYMWVASIQGFYLLRQHVHGRINEDWRIIAEIIGEEYSALLFDEIWDEIESLVTRAESARGQSPENDPGLA